MKVKLKYPIFSFAPKGNMIYVFRKEKLYTTTNTELLKKRKNYIVVDATGTKYVEKGAHKVKWQGIFGYCIRMQGRVISIEYEYGDNPEPFPLRKLQELVAERYPKTRWFKEECWNSADEFRQAIFACKTFEEVAERNHFLSKSNFHDFCLKRMLKRPGKLKREGYEKWCERRLAYYNNHSQACYR